MRVNLNLTHRNCPICRSAENSSVFAEADFDPEALTEFAFASRKLPEYMHYRLLQCAECDLVYASPAPTPDALGPAYEEAAYDSGEEARCAARTYARILARIAGRLPDKRGALDIGAGDGAFLEQLLEIGFTDVAGVEPSCAPIEAASPAVRHLIRKGIFHRGDFEEEKFSLITCFQTLEHLYDPLAMCSDAYRMLKPGGAVIFVCHNRRSVSARILGFRSPIFDIEHLQLFSSPSADSLLKSAGFVDIETRYVVNSYPLTYWLRLMPLPARLKQGLIILTRRIGFGRVKLSAPVGNLAVIGFKPR